MFEDVPVHGISRDGTGRPTKAMHQRNLSLDFRYVASCGSIPVGNGVQPLEHSNKVRQDKKFYSHKK